jgi:hypothetical protein
MPLAAIETYPDGSTNVTGWIVLQSHNYASRMTTGCMPLPGYGTNVSTPFGITMFDTDNYAYRGNAIAQSFPTVPGWPYRVTFFGSREPWRLREWMPASRVTLQVSVAQVTNVYTSHFNAGLEGGMNWSSFSFTFIATSDLSTLTFRQTEGPYDYDGVCLDEVSVAPLRELTIDRDGQVCFPSEKNKVYKIQSASTLPASSDSWNDLASSIQGTGDIICHATSLSASSTRFYRLVELP